MVAKVWLAYSVYIYYIETDCVYCMRSDLQMVEISLRVLFKPDTHHLPFIYRRLGQGMLYRYHHMHMIVPNHFNEIL